MKCPSCSSSRIVEGHTGFGEEIGGVSFYPHGLRWFRFPRRVPLLSKEKLNACIDCGLVWARVAPDTLQAVLVKAGTAELRKRTAIAD